MSVHVLLLVEEEISVNGELRALLAKETCPKCKGQRYVAVKLPKGQADFRKCPECNGVGYKIRKLAGC